MVVVCRDAAYGQARVVGVKIERLPAVHDQGARCREGSGDADRVRARVRERKARDGLAVIDAEDDRGEKRLFRAAVGYND